MVVYGVALLAFCTLAGVLLGDILGVLLGVKANVGGVGIAMLLLIVLSSLSSEKLHISVPTKSGIHFWSAMYIPIVVAMAARQNVVAAVSSGWVAVFAGAGAVALSFALIPLFSRIGPDGVDSLTEEKVRGE